MITLHATGIIYYFWQYLFNPCIIHVMFLRYNLDTKKLDHKMFLEGFIRFLQEDQILTPVYLFVTEIVSHFCISRKVVHPLQIRPL